MNKAECLTLIEVYFGPASGWRRVADQTGVTETALRHPPAQSIQSGRGSRMTTPGNEVNEHIVLGCYYDVCTDRGYVNQIDVHVL